MKKLILLAVLLLPALAFAQSEPKVTINSSVPLLLIRDLDRVMQPQLAAIRLEHILPGDKLEGFIGPALKNAKYKQHYITADGYPSEFHARTNIDLNGKDVYSCGAACYNIDADWQGHASPNLLNSASPAFPEKDEVRLAAGVYPLILRVQRGAEVFSIEPGNFEIKDIIPQGDADTTISWENGNKISINPDKKIYEDVNDSKLFLKINPAAADIILYIHDKSLGLSNILEMPMPENMTINDVNRVEKTLNDIKNEGALLRPPYTIGYDMEQYLRTHSYNDYFISYFIPGKGSEMFFKDNNGTPKKYYITLIYMADGKVMSAGTEFSMDHNASKSTAVKNVNADKTVKSISAYDVTGKKLGDFPDEERLNSTLNNLNGRVGIIKYQMSNGTIETKKVLR